MILRILSDEIAAFLSYLALMLSGWYYFGQNNSMLYLVTSIFLSLIYWLTFLGIKFYIPQMLSNEGRYEDCIRFCNRELFSRYSITNLVHSTRHLNYFRMNASYCHMKLGDFHNAGEIIEKIDEKNVLKGQFILLRMIKAHLLINRGKLSEALELLVNIQTGTLSEKFLPDIFYLLSLCYLELKIEMERAMNYAQVAFSLRKNNLDYKLNWAVALYKVQKSPLDAKEIMDNIYYKGLDELSVFSKPRLLYYLRKLSLEVGDEDSSKKYERLLIKDYGHCSFFAVVA